MNIKVIGIIICLLFTIPVIAAPVRADPGATLEIKIFGGLPLPLFIRQLAGAISNVGNTTAYNVSYLLTIHGGILGAIDESREGYAAEILPQQALGVTLMGTFGFGPVTITLNATASNAENVSGSARGFQLCEFTWVPFSWIIP